MRRLVAYGLWVLLFVIAWGDESVSPLVPRYEASLERPVKARGVYAIRNVTVHPITAPPIENATVLIRDGKIAEMVKDVVLSGNLFTTLQNIDAIAGDLTFSKLGTCGKGQGGLPVSTGSGRR